MTASEAGKSPSQCVATSQHRRRRPGSNKTGLIEALTADGIPHLPEGGRAIVRDPVDIGGPAPRARPDRSALSALRLRIGDPTGLDHAGTRRNQRGGAGLWVPVQRPREALIRNALANRRPRQSGLHAIA